MAVAGYVASGRTVAELVATTEEHLGKSRHQLNKLTAAIADTTTPTIPFEFEAGGIRNGAYIEIDDEVMYVWSVSGQNATVERGALGSTPATHADNTLVRVNPRFLRISILRALREEIASWPRSIYAVLLGDYTVAVNVTSLDVAGIPTGATGLRLLKVWRQQSHTTESPYRWPAVNGVMLEAGAEDASFPSGYRLVWPGHNMAGTYQVALGGPFLTATFVSATDLGTIGLTTPMIDIPPLGAAARLLLPQEVARTDAGALGRSRLAEEVPPGYTSRTSQELLAWRDTRIADEAKRLLNDYGWTE